MATVVGESEQQEPVPRGRLKRAVLRGVSLALVMSALLWLTHWSDSLLGLVVFFVLVSALLSTTAYFRGGRRAMLPTRLERHGRF